jgi:hypothetical protein
MRIRLAALLVLVSFGVGAATAAPRTRNFSSSTDRNGKMNNASAQVNANGTIRCTAATGADPRNNPPACFVTTTGGGSMRLEPGKEMGTGTAGTMTLTCNGKAPMNCSVSIVD